MATDANNLKLSRITGATAAQFLTTIIASGSVYWHEVQKRIFVGDGVAEGGIAVAMEKDFDSIIEAFDTAIANCGGTPIQD